MPPRSIRSNLALVCRVIEPQKEPAAFLLKDQIAHQVAALSKPEESPPPAIELTPFPVRSSKAAAALITTVRACHHGNRLQTVCRATTWRPAVRQPKQLPRRLTSATGFPGRYRAETS